MPTTTTSTATMTDSCSTTEVATSTDAWTASVDSAPVAPVRHQDRDHFGPRHRTAPRAELGPQCYNCRRYGHAWHFCPVRPLRVFCTACGRMNIRAEDCDCRQMQQDRKRLKAMRRLARKNQTGHERQTFFFNIFFIFFCFRSKMRSANWLIVIKLHTLLT